MVIILQAYSEIVIEMRKVLIQVHQDGDVTAGNVAMQFLTLISLLVCISNDAIFKDNTMN